MKPRVRVVKRKADDRRDEPQAGDAKEREGHEAKSAHEGRRVSPARGASQSAHGSLSRRVSDTSPSPHASTSRRVSAARRAAFEILRRVEDEAAFAAPLLASAAEELRAEDRGLCYELVLGCLRRQLWLDHLTEALAGRDAATLDAPVRRALRLGLYQLRFLSRIPPSAAVNESVNLMHEARLRSASGFVNAVLRRATREPSLDPAAQITDPIQRLAVESSHPAWLIKRWTQSFGIEETTNFAHANNLPPPLSFRVNSLRAGSDEVIARLEGVGARASASTVAPDAWRINEGGGEGTALLRRMAEEGLIYMQDEASQLVAHVVGARAGERVLDACAAPGSKTTHIAALASDAAFVFAGDRIAHRLRLLRETAARLGLERICPVVLDAEGRLPFADATFDRALVDAPCSGTGTLRHNPEIRWRITPADVEELAARQRRILARVARTLRAGGRLVYSTCSVEREENEETVRAFLESHADLRQVTAEPARPALLDASGAARTWPHREGSDGFFVAAFEKLGH